MIKIKDVKLFLSPAEIPPSYVGWGETGVDDDKPWLVIYLDSETGVVDVCFYESTDAEDCVPVMKIEFESDEETYDIYDYIEDLLRFLGYEIVE